MVQLPIWALLGIVIALCIIFRGARTWIVIVAVALGVYIAQTEFGQEAKKGGDSVVDEVNEHQK